VKVFWARFSTICRLFSTSKSTLDKKWQYFSKKTGLQHYCWLFFKIYSISLFEKEVFKELTYNM